MFEKCSKFFKKTHNFQPIQKNSINNIIPSELFIVIFDDKKVKSKPFPKQVVFTHGRNVDALCRVVGTFFLFRFVFSVFNNFCRIPNSNGKRRDVFCHDSSGTYNCMFANGDA